MRDRDLTSEDVSRLASTAELMEMQWAPCRVGCPVHADVRTYIERIAEGRWRDAIDVIRRHLAFAAVCGRVCHHPCESNCRRQEVDEPVAVREVKRYVAELQGAEGATVHKAPSQNKAPVAIVGAGPAGLTAALELAKMGYRPTVFEKFPVAGGIPATAIPTYRLPREVLQIDIDWICAHGVQLRTGVEIGRDKTIEDLKKEGFEAVLIAAGLAASRALPMPGCDHKRVLGVLEFLTDVCFDRRPDVGKDVLVIGGGNVAMDAARTAVRLGAGRVRAMCLENEQEMPAWDWEREEAQEEGVSFIHRRGPVEVLIDDGEITAVKTRKVTRVFDEQERFAPRYDDSDVTVIECDTVIMAIGQMADYGFVEGSGLAADDRGRIQYNPATQQTSRPDVFACGEIVTPPGSVVEACASGRRVATAIDLHLAGRPIDIDDSLPAEIDKIAPETAEKVIKAARTPVRAEPPEARAKTFVQIDHNYDESSAMREARRCMGCGGGAEVLVDKCVACLTCLRVCPFDIPSVTDVARIESRLCQACGLCIAECPANAIVARSWDAKEYVKRPADLLGEVSRAGKIVAFICGHRACAAEWNGLAEKVPGVVEIYLPSMARLSAADLLHAFENGADGVIVVACAAEAERYPTATERIGRRVGQVRRMLEEIGMKAQALQLVEVAHEGRSAVRRAMAEAAEQISGA